jgi:hypothetical protein
MSAVLRAEGLTRVPPAGVPAPRSVRVRARHGAAVISQGGKR